MQVQKTYLKVTYNNVDISADISKSLVSFSYTDNLEDGDTLDIELEDKELLWQNEWYPDKGAVIVAEIGIEGGAKIQCGKFEVDEIEIAGPPDTVRMRCIAAGFKHGQKRTHKSHVHEGKTLAEIVRTVADNAGLTIQGNAGTFRIGRVVQRKERDMRFLRRLGINYGYIFNIRGNVITFMSREELENTKPVVSFDKTDLLNYSIRDKSTDTYSAATLKFHNPETGEVVTHTETTGGLDDTDDVLELTTTAETKAQAIAITQSALSRLNKLQQSGSISLPGHHLLVAGNVIELTGLGMLSGNYLIKTSAHVISIGDGWLVDVEIYKVGYIDITKHKPKKKKKSLDLNIED